MDNVKERILMFAVNEYNNYLLYGKKTLDALQHLIIKRGLTRNDIKRFQIGYAPPNQRFILKKLLEAGYLQKDIEDSGLLKKGELKDKFGGYVILPNIIQGQVVHITGRYVGKQNEEKHKHLNGSIHYLYNMGSFDDSVQQVIIVESPLDAIILSSQLNLPNILANYGATTKSKRLYEPLKAKKIYIVFDDDDAGEREALNLSNFLWKNFRNNCLIVKLSLDEIDKDITDFFLATRHTFKEQLKPMFQNAINYNTTEHYRLSVQSEEKPTKREPVKYNKETLDKKALAKSYPMLNILAHYFPGLPKKLSHGNQIPCPFHEETKPSFTVYEKDNRFFCFGCGIKGDTIDLVKRLESKLGRQINFNQAMDIILSL